MEPRTVSAREFAAPAKINLFLHVVGRRRDGYHLLQTAFRLLDYGDTLSLEVRDDGAICRLHAVPGVPSSSDLCVRAALLLQSEARMREGVSIAVKKRLPVGGGLGGGSSDAASVLLALNRLWNLNWRRTRLQELGLQLGADVPFFIYGRSAFAEGVGERLKPVDLPNEWYLVIETPMSISTPEIFAAPELTRETKPIKIADFSVGWAREQGRNDLQPVVCRRYPRVAAALEWLGQFKTARMSGSGGSVFAAFEEESAARVILGELPVGWHGWVARGLDRHPLWEFAA